MQYQSIRIVRPGQFDSATVQTPGSQRLAAVHPEAGIDSAMWGGIFRVQPPARQSTITVSKTRSRMCSAALPMFGGAGRESSMPPCMRAVSSTFRRGFPTRKSILRVIFSFKWVVVRSTSEPIVVNLSNTFDKKSTCFRIIPDDAKKADRSNDEVMKLIFASA
jgi:hypothetical protein